MENLKFYDEFRKVPENAKKPIRGGRTNGFTDINPMWRIKMLTEAFGMCGFGWYYEVTDKRLEWNTEQPTGEISAFVDINLFVKVGNEWSKPIAGTGGSSFVSKEKNGLYQSDECFKMALTDAISVACKALGIGADVYWEADRTKYSARTEQKSEETPKKRENKPITFEDNIRSELRRTGVGLNGILRKYNVAALSDLTEEQAQDCITKLGNMPNKPETA